jgi:hypothetical protein
MINAADINVFVARHLPRYLQEIFEVLKYNCINSAMKLLIKSRGAI